MQSLVKAWFKLLERVSDLDKFKSDIKDITLIATLITNENPESLFSYSNEDKLVFFAAVNNNQHRICLLPEQLSGLFEQHNLPI